MRIARIIEYFPPRIGGMERHGLVLTKEQIKLGHEVDVFISYGDLNQSFKIYKMPFQFLPLYSKLHRLLFNIWAYCAVKKNHKEKPYDIIHLHGDLVEAYFGTKLAKKLNITIILTIHGGLNPKILTKSNAAIFNNLNHIICVSEEIKSDLLSICVNSNKLSVISSGIYLKEFNGPQSALEYSKPILISAGMLTKQKGFDYLVSAFKRVKEKISGASLLIVGDGPERNKLESLAKDINNLYFLGNLPHEQVIKLLVGADIFVLASITMPGYKEGTPVVLMEAMAAGLPIIATKSGGIPYLIKDRVNGFLVEEKNSEALAQAMIKLIGDENLKPKMRRNNLGDIKQRDWSNIIQKIMSIYNECLN